MKWIIAPVLVGVMSSVPAAHAEEGCKEAYEVGKDIARLDAEMNAMKKLLAELLELDRRRTALLSKALRDGGSVDLAALSPNAPPPPDAPPPKTKRQRTTAVGSVGGRVQGGSGAAFVYVGDVRGRLVRGKSTRVVQKNKRFAPGWLVVQRGTSVIFPNEDGIYHNVFSTSPGANFDLGIYRRGDKARSYTFTKAGLIDIHCNMHAKMNAEILVVPNHMYTRVKKDGSFTLKRVPAGRHKIVAWSPGHGLTEKWVDVPSNGRVDVDFAVSPRTKRRHLDKDGKPYSSYD